MPSWCIYKICAFYILIFLKKYSEDKKHFIFEHTTVHYDLVKYFAKIYLPYSGKPFHHQPRKYDLDLYFVLHRVQQPGSYCDQWFMGGGTSA